MAEAGGVKPGITSHLHAQLGEGPPRWGRKFARGFDVVGAFRRAPHFRLARKKNRSALWGDPPWGGASGILATRSVQAVSRGTEIWEFAIGKIGRAHSRQKPTPVTGGSASRDRGPVYAAFGLPNVQMGKIRARDDLKYGDANPACAARAPVEFPNRGHIDEICLGVEDSNRERPYGAADRYAAYRNLLMNQSQAGACVATMMRFHPTVPTSRGYSVCVTL